MQKPETCSISNLRAGTGAYGRVRARTGGYGRVRAVRALTSNSCSATTSPRANAASRYSCFLPLPCPMEEDAAEGNSIARRAPLLSVPLTRMELSHVPVKML